MKQTRWFIFFILIAVSCLDEPDCFNINNNWIGISFKVIGSSKPDTVALIGVTLSGSVTEYQEVDSSVVTGVPVPLNFYTEGTTITFLRPGGNNTMALSYDVQSQFVSDECGSRFVLSNLVIDNHDFDSARLLSATPGGSRNTRNIEIYRCPINNLVGFQYRQLYPTTPRSSQPANLPVKSIVADYSGSTFYLNDTVSVIYLRVDTTQSGSTFTFTLPDNTTETIKLKYAVTHEQRYRVCGTQPFVSQLRIDSTNIAFDSVAIVRDETTSRLKNIVQDPADINVNFYRCPDTNLARISFQTRRSATDTTTRADTVSLKQIRANHLADPIVYNANLSFVNIPLDEAADAAVFYLDYLDGSIDTVDLEYTRNFVQYYKSCGEQVIFSGLLRDHDNINIIQSQVQFPPVTNIEILH